MPGTPSKPSDHKEMLSLVIDAIERGSPMTIDAAGLTLFHENNLQSFADNFGDWSEAVHMKLLRVAHNHGVMSSAVSRILHKNNTVVSVDDFIVAGKFVRALTPVLPEPSSAEKRTFAHEGTKKTEDDELPRPGTAGPWCSWP